MSTENMKNIENTENNKADAENTSPSTLNFENYTVNLRKPVEYDGKIYEKLTFNFEKLKGSDSLKIENELARLGKTAISPAFSAEFIIRLAARACTENIGFDIFEILPLKDFEKVRGITRSFLLQ